jgi:hypothetical protein
VVTSLVNAKFVVFLRYDVRQAGEHPSDFPQYHRITRTDRDRQVARSGDTAQYCNFLFDSHNNYSPFSGQTVIASRRTSSAKLLTRCIPARNLIRAARLPPVVLTASPDSPATS